MTADVKNENLLHHLEQVSSILEELQQEDLMRIFQQLRLDYNQTFEFLAEHNEDLSNIELLSINGIIESSKIKGDSQAANTFMEIKDNIQNYENKFKKIQEQLKDKKIFFDRLDIHLGRLKSIIEGLKALKEDIGSNEIKE